MKSLIKKTKAPAKTSTAREVQPEKPTEKIAQCCAKVSKAVAGCHD